MDKNCSTFIVDHICFCFVTKANFQRQTFRFLFYFSAAGVECLVVAVNCVPILHHSSDYIFVSFGLWSPFWLLWKLNTAWASARGQMQPHKLHCCIWRDLTLKAPRKIWSRRHFKFYIFFFFIFQRKVLTFHVNRLLSRRFTWKVKTCFLWKIRKNQNVVCCICDWCYNG